MAMNPANLVDPNDGVALRTFFESLRGKLAGDRSSWDGQWKQCSAFFAPRMSRFNDTDVNRGERKDFEIINETGLLALRTLKAGMFTGMSGQTRPWFLIRSDNDKLNERHDARDWFQDTERRVRTVFLKSNVYQTLLQAYGDEALYGTTAFTVLDDERSVIRCHPFPIGSYYLMQDDTLRIDGCVRVLQMTVRQIVERFGIDNVSDSMRTQYESNAGGVKETFYPIVHVITSGRYFAPKSYRPAMPWYSIYYEMSAFKEKQGVLSRSGFMENPLIVGRWNVVGENIYGESAAMDCLGSVMSLQCWEERIAQGAEKQFNPPVVASTEIDVRKATLLPGDVMWVDGREVDKLIAPAYKVDFRLDGGLTMLQRIEQRINDAMYRSLFLMFAESDRREITAAEIHARQQEKMQVLGPVVERNVEEVLAPLVKRTMSIMMRRGILRPMPDSLKNQPIKLEFVSILAQAHKFGRLSNLTSLMQFVGSEVALDQGVIDNVDLDKATQRFAENADVDVDVLRSPDQVEKRRADRARQQQLAVAAEAAPKLAGAAKQLSETELGTGSALDAALPALAGGSE